jgi:glycosyltransferase involved in cell wall biosynthesis
MGSVCFYSGAAGGAAVARRLRPPPLGPWHAASRAVEDGFVAEVLADAAELLPPREPAAWAAAVTRLLRDGGRRAELIARGEERAAEFTWERTAHATRAIYAEALGAGRP